MTGPASPGRLAAMLASGLAAGCATAPPPPPVTAYAVETCDSAPNLSRAASLVPERPRRFHSVAVTVDSATPCLRRREAPTPYVVYALPAEGAARMIEVGGQMEPARIFSPAVAILDANGNTLRSFAPDQYLYRGGVFSVQFVPQPGERFILVTADPARIGQRYDAIAISTSTTTIVTPYFVSNWRSGVDQSISRTFSYEGAVVAVVHGPEEVERQSGSR